MKTGNNFLVKFQMPKSGKPQKGNWFMVAFLESYRSIFLNIGFKMFDHRKYPTDSLCLCASYMLASGLLVHSSVGTHSGRVLCLDAAPERLWWDRSNAHKPECLGSFPYIPTYFYLWPWSSYLGSLWIHCPLITMKINNSICFIGLLRV